MREIKFRAWVEGASVMETWESLSDADLTGFLKGEYSNIKVMQYTGLKDKNGVEIYEGDIVRMLERTINGAEFIHICQVFQHESGLWRIEGTCVSSGVKLPKTNMGLHSNQKRVEVIGNCYENSGLLEG